MSDHPKATDAELVERLKLVKQHGSISKAAREIGISRSSMSASISDAKKRKLTVDTLIVDEASTLRVKLKAAENEATALRRDRDTAEAIRERLYELSARSPEPPEWLQKAGRVGHRG